MNRFSSHDDTTAPEAARPILRGSLARFGFIPSPVARSAESPTLLAHMMASFAAFDRSSLSDVEREVVAMTVAFEAGCHYCMAMHSALLAPEHAELVHSLRAGAMPESPRLAALQAFVRETLARKGDVTEDTWARFEGAGFDRRAGLDVVLGVGTYVLSTFANRMTNAPLDAAFAAHEWRTP